MTLLPTPISTRRDIPFYHAKSEAEFKDDVYERYDELVTRQTGLHLADELHGGYPFQALLDYILRWLPATEPPLAIADLGCSVGRLAAEMAIRQPSSTVYGLDLSYQMLRQGHDFWVRGETLQPNLLRYGFGNPALKGHQLTNLHFALAKAEELPFPDASLDLILNTFLIDRLPQPLGAFTEWARVLKPGGRLITVSPLNFLKTQSWRDAHPPARIITQLMDAGWQLEDLTDPLLLDEPMDARGNAVRWKTLAFVASRR